MKLSWVQIIFYYLLDILLLLLFLLGESFLGIYVIGAFAIFFLFYSRYLDFSKVGQYRMPIALWLTFLLAILFSSLFTHNIPLTIGALVFYFFIFVSFIFFLILKRDILNVEVLLLNLLVIVFDLGLISLFFLLAPEFAKELPGMNLLYPTYGHNHYGAIAILFIPINWYFFVKHLHDRKKAFVFGGSLFFLVLNLVLSFGRVVTLLGFLEIIILFISTKKTLHFKKPMLGIVVFLLILTGSALVTKNIFSIAGFWGDSVTCPFPDQKDRICKSIRTDLRASYWLASFRAISDQVWVGYGPGTYKMITEKYKLRPDAGTSYAHNAVLQILAESGLLAGLLFFLILVVFLFKIARYLKADTSVFSVHKQPSYLFFISLGLLMIIVNCMFDFDWNFVGIAFVSFVLFAVLLRIDTFPNLFKKRKVKVIQFFFYISALLLIISSLLSFSVELMFFKKMSNEAVSFFPYFPNHIQLFLEDESLTDENKKKVEKIYSQTPFLYIRNTAKYQNSWEILDEIAPWHFYESNYSANFISEDKERVKEELLRTADLYQRAKRFGYRGMLSADGNLAKQSITVADKFLFEGDYESAADLYITAVKFDNWVFNNTFPRFLFDLQSIEQSDKFWKNMRSFPLKYYGKHLDAVGAAHRSIFEFYLEKGDTASMKYWLGRLLKVTPWLNDAVGTYAVPKIQSLSDRAINNGDWQQAEELVNILYQFNTYYAKEQIGNFYLLKGDSGKANQWYESCNDWWLEYRQEVHEDCAKMIGSTKNQDDQLYWLVSASIKQTK